MKSFALTFTVLAGLASATFAAGCSASPTEGTSEEDIKTGAATLTLLQGLPLDTTWEQVPARVKQQLAKNASKRLKDYEKAWGKQALSAQANALITAPTNEATAAFDDFVRKVYGQFLTNGETYTASTSMRPALRDALKKLHVVRIAAWRLNVQNYGNQQALEVDGVTRIEEFPLPSVKATHDYREVAAEVLAEVRGLSKLALDDSEKAIVERATNHARSLAAGSSNFRGGSDDLMDIWSRGAWAYDLAWAHSDTGGKFMQDDQAYAEILNAYYEAPLTHVDKGTINAFPFLTEAYTDVGFIKEQMGSDPATSDAAKAYLLLTRWFIERTNALPEATKACTVYENRDAMWEGFTADILVNNDGKSTLAGFQNDADKLSAANLALFKGYLVEAVKTFGAEKKLTATQVAAVEAAVKNEARYGLVRGAAVDAFEAVEKGLGAGFSAKLDDIPTVGGYAENEALRSTDEAAVQRIFADVKTFLATTYHLDTTKLPAKVTVRPNSTAFTTGQSGEIAIGLKEKKDEAYLYSVLLHESHHSYNFANHVFVEGAGWEGAAKVTETRVYPALVRSVLTARQEASKTPYYLATMYGGLNVFAAKTEATVQVLLRSDCSGPDTVALTEAIATKWGITDKAAMSEVAVRSHHGPSYLQYTAGEILYTAFLDRLSAAVGGAPVDPFQVQACGLTFAPETPATIAALKTCLGR